MSIRRCYRLPDLVSLMSSLYFLKHPYLPKKPHHHHNPFPVVPLCHPECCISLCCLSSGGSFLGNVLLLVSGFQMLHFRMLGVGYFLTTNVHELV